MGGKSTSDSAVLDDKGQEAAQSFDLHSWQGLTKVLSVGKDALPAVEYAEFRNLILGYAQQGGDVELRKRIDSIIATFGSLRKLDSQTANSSEAEDVQTSKRESSVHPSGIGVRRIQPKFAMREGSSKPAPQDEVKPTPQVVKAPESVVPAPVQKPQVTVVEAEKVVVNEVKADTQEAPAEEPASVPVQAIPTPTQAPAPKEFASLETHKTRISEIKRQVHEHIGNPAALMGSHNDLGKKYMTALLSALKATGSGGTEGVDSAMQALEQAYDALLHTDTKPTETTITPTQESVTAPQIPPTREPEEEVVVPVIEPEAVVEAEPEEDSTEAEVAPEPEPVLEVEVSREESIEKEETNEPPKHSAASTLASLLQRTAQRDIQPAKKADEAIGREPYLAHERKTDGASSSYPQSKHANKGIAATDLGAIRVETGIDPASVAVRQSELATPQITKELHDLLHEWKIFSGSGLFGIGPGGAEHPLYIKLSTLSMGEVLAGRWDNSDIKVIKVIKEYVNAWRHEQGVAHSVDETFEHYLRRVVQRIQRRRG